MANVAEVQTMVVNGHQVRVATNLEIRPGYSPYIGDNGNWYVYDTTVKAFVDTGILAETGRYIQVSNTQPTDPENIIWFKDEAEEELTIPTYEEFTDLNNELNESVTDLKSDLSELSSELIHVSSNRLDMTAITPNTYINTDGSSTASQNFSVTDYIPVTEGETIHFWSQRVNGTGDWLLFDARFLCAYNANKVAVPSSGGTFVGGNYTVPSGIAYVRLSISNDYLTNWDNFYVGTLNYSQHSQYEPYGSYPILEPQVEENTANIAENTANIAENTNALATISEKTSNLFNENTMTDGYYILADGSIEAYASFSITDYIPVTEGDTIYTWALVDGAYQAVYRRTRCCFDANKNPIASEGDNSENRTAYTVGEGVAFIRLTFRDTVLAYDNLYVGTHPVGTNYEPYGRKVKISNFEEPSYTVVSGESILEGVQYCYANGIKKLIVEAGTYDVIAEYETKYGSDYFTNYTNYATDNPYDRGIWLENIDVVFNAGAKVVCKYTGSNTNVPLYFSAFATGNNVSIDGLVLDSENLRYGIHADFNSGTKQTYFYVKNCDLRHYKNATSNQAIGAGLGRHVLWIFENTIFRSDVNHICFRIHNNVNSDAQSKVIVKDCYIDGDGYFQFNSYSTSTLQTIIQVCGCSYKTVPVVGKETQDSNDNFTMIAWNNEVRS